MWCNSRRKSQSESGQRSEVKFRKRGITERQVQCSSLKTIPDASNLGCGGNENVKGLANNTAEICRTEHHPFTSTRDCPRCLNCERRKCEAGAVGALKLHSGASGLVELHLDNNTAPYTPRCVMAIERVVRPAGTYEELMKLTATRLELNVFAER